MGASLGADHVGAPAMRRDAPLIVGIVTQHRPTGGGAFSACLWAISGTTKFQTSGGSRL
jgi:hypothetical protein